MKIKIELKILALLGLFALVSCQTNDSGSGSMNEDGSHPCLILRKESVGELKQGLTNLPVFKSSFEEIQEMADKALEAGVVVPIPKDPGGGYTHEQHKRNYMAMYSSGISYQLTGETKYGDFVKAMLLEYAEMYPTLGVHPQKKNQAPGKLFWQGLNESVWLVYTIQAYDCVYDYMSVEEREQVETNLFRKVVEFFTIEDSYSFNRVHNHGTWAAAGVGMTGMVLNDSNYVDMALYGTDKSGEAGFLKQIDELFSPDGFYAEGPYYQRYAIMPFILFAQALDNNRKDINIFEFKDDVLNKAVITLLQLTNMEGGFFPLNDAIKEKNYLSPELIFATNIAFSNTQNPELLSIAQKHGKVMISKQGLDVADAINNGLSKEFVRTPVLISDGSKGKQGGVIILRDEVDNNKLSVLVKATSQGMGHGHFDRLEFMMYENGTEIIQDYGAARFLNIEAKHGGRYLPENNSWAKHTIAHNTLVVNGESNFSGDLKAASKNHAEVLYVELDSPDVQVVAVSDSHCYENAVLQRTMALFTHKKSSFVLDLFRVINGSKSTYDLPLYYKGQTMSTNFNANAATTRINVLGDKNGYQHLWNIGHATELEEMNSVTWMNGVRFYTYNFTADDNTELFFTRISANDPEFNLRNEPGLMIRQKNSGMHSFLSVIEAHGQVDPVKETVAGTNGSVKALKLIYQGQEASIVKVSFEDGEDVILCLAHKPNAKAEYKIEVDTEIFSWVGNYNFTSKGVN